MIAMCRTTRYSYDYSNHCVLTTQTPIPPLSRWVDYSTAVLLLYYQGERERTPSQRTRICPVAAARPPPPPAPSPAPLTAVAGVSAAAATRQPANPRSATPSPDPEEASSRPGAPGPAGPPPPAPPDRRKGRPDPRGGGRQFGKQRSSLATTSTHAHTNTEMTRVAR
jgi:hypothetical protein